MPGDNSEMARALNRIAHMARLAWLSPKTVRSVFEKIEYDALRALGENPPPPRSWDAALLRETETRKPTTGATDENANAPGGA